MIEPGRAPCCIDGCGRTFKGPGEVLCGRHFRCDATLLDRIKRIRRRFRMVVRRLNKLYGQGLISAELCEARHVRWEALEDAAWAAIKAKAQELQDAGFWAPRPRNRQPALKRKQAVSPLNNAFEANFQAQKRAMMHGGQR